MSDRDRRALLWLCCAGVCWRWFVGIRTPMPGVGACSDLWLAEQLLAGDAGPLLARFWEPFYALLLSPVILCGASLVTAAKIVACLLGGLAVVPAALAAERLREGAGVSAAAVTMVAAGPVVAAGAGAATAMFALLVACGLWAFACRRYFGCALLLLVVVAGGLDKVASAAPPLWDQLRLGLGAAVLLLPLLWLRPRSKSFAILFAGLLVVVVVAAALGAWTSLLPMHSPLVAVLVGLGLARLPVRLRDVLLSVVVAIECHAAWTLGEPEAAVVERVLPHYLARRVHGEGETVLVNLPRVRWAAGQDPDGAERAFAEAIGDDRVGTIVMTAEEAADASLRAMLAAKFERAQLPTDLAELLLQRRLHVLRRRHD